MLILTVVISVSPDCEELRLQHLSIIRFQAVTQCLETPTIPELADFKERRTNGLMSSLVRMLTS
ncbi:MAG: hypothetical protein KME23_04480 [Goleter apudmare HA4340-LM2]|jgi:hypothetical protein|nr:hypothetical protein [Goleter apudmare HA4340-LM2]